MDGSFELSEEETKLFKLLLAVISFHSLSETVVLRVAGGWVRDKLLGRSSSDIDVVVSGIDCRAFLDLLNQYLDAHDQERKTYSVMEPSPEHGKHVPNYNMALFGISVDFVPLRGSPPSPLRDALLRDLTVNALHYNIARGCVEDATGKGLPDLKQRILRAPTEPRETLSYDPLRALRVARFAACMNQYAVEGRLMEAMASDETREELGRRTKRDRIGQELRKALNARHAHLAVQILQQTHLLDVVFFGDDGKLPQNDQRAREAAHLCNTVYTVLERSGLKDVPRLPLYIAAVLWSQAPLPLVKKVSPLYLIVTNALRLSHVEGVQVVTVASGAMAFSRLAHEGARKVTRLSLGLCLRQCGPLWPCAWALAVALSENSDPVLVPELEMIRKLVSEMRLEGIWDMKPLLNGNQIAAALQIQPGPVFATLSSRLIEQQLMEPNLSPDGAVEFLKRVYSELR